MRRIIGITLVCALIAAVSAIWILPRELGSGTKTLREDQWTSIEITLARSSAVQVEYELTSGPAVDVYVLSEADMNRWRTLVSKNQVALIEDWKYYKHLSFEGLSVSYTSEWVKLDKGKHFLLIDNTDTGATMPPMNFHDDVATVAYTVRARLAT